MQVRKAVLSVTERNRLVEANTHVARDLAWKFRKNGCRVEFDDLYHEALAVMCRAGAGYDPSRGVPFGAFVRPAVANGLIDFLRRWSRHPAGVEAPGDDAAGSTDLIDPASERSLAVLEDREEIDHACRDADWREKALLALRYHANCPYREISEITGIGGPQLRAMHFRLMRRLRLAARGDGPVSGPAPSP